NRKGILVAWKRASGTPHATPKGPIILLVNRLIIATEPCYINWWLVLHRPSRAPECQRCECPHVRRHRGSAVSVRVGFRSLSHVSSDAVERSATRSRVGETAARAPAPAARELVPAAARCCARTRWCTRGARRCVA